MAERAEERRRSARNRKIVVDAMWETGETYLVPLGGKRKKCRKETVGPVAANPLENLESNKVTKKQGGGAHGTQGSIE